MSLSDRTSEDSVGQMHFSTCFVVMDSTGNLKKAVASHPGVGWGLTRHVNTQF